MDVSGAFADIEFEAVTPAQALEHRTLKFQVSDYGKVSPAYGDEYPTIYAAGSAMVVHGGVVMADGVVQTSSFFEIYRSFSNVDDEIKFYHERFCQESDYHYAGRVDFTINQAIYCEHLWDRNYQHFMVETLPRLWVLAQIPAYAGLPLIVSDFEYVREIAVLCFPGREFIYINENSKIMVTGQVVFCSAIAKNFAEISEPLIGALRFLRDCVLRHVAGLEQAGLAPELSYFGRKFAAEYAGNRRVMENFSYLEPILQEHGFEITDFDGKLIIDKAKLLRHLRCAVSPIGANLMNFLFAPQNSVLIVINHPIFNAAGYFFDLLASLGFDRGQMLVFEDVEVADKENVWPNCPYVIDIEKFRVFLPQMMQKIG